MSFTVLIVLGLQAVMDVPPGDGGKPVVNRAVAPACGAAGYGVSAQLRAQDMYAAMDVRELLDRGAPVDPALGAWLARTSDDITAPSPVRAALEIDQSLMPAGVESACVTVFDVATNGQTANRAVACDVKDFESLVEAALAKSLFTPARAGGKLGPVRNVLMPVNFCLP